MQNTTLFNRIALITTLITLCVIVLGAYVRLSDAGLGCPDWPGCYGTLTVPQSSEAIANAQLAYPNSPVEHPKAWKEMIHRYLATALGLFILALFAMGWRNSKQLKVSPWLTTLLVGLVVFQGMLGMWTVTLLLKPVIVSAHLLGGMSTLAILTWVTHRHWGASSGNYLTNVRLRWMLRIAIAVLFIQIFLGGWTSTNYAGLACTDFPTCHGAWLPNMDFFNAFHLVRELGQGADNNPLGLDAYVAIQWIHRLGALITFLYLGYLGSRLLRQPQLSALSSIMLALLVVQVSLGIANVVLHMPLVLAVGHNMVAALLLITIVMLNSKITAQHR